VIVSDSTRHLQTSQSPEVVSARAGRKPTRKAAATTWPQITAIPSAGLGEQHIVPLLFRISIRLQKSLDRCFVPFGLTSQEAAALLLCAETGGISAGRLAKAMGRDKGKITHFVSRLERAKFLLRKNHTRDRRLVVLHATRRGQQVVPELRAIFEELRASFLAGLLAQEIAGLSSILSQLYENIGRFHPPPLVNVPKPPHNRAARPPCRSPSSRAR
jgi:MarR family transcriptional regulator for hemolysin